MRALLILLTQISLALGHGALDEQIAIISAKISASPDDPKLLLARADLHHSHRDPQAARSDLLRASKITPPHPPAFLKLARFERKQNRPAPAKAALQKYFLHTPRPDPLAHRELALISPPKEALHPWQLYLQKNNSPAMRDYALAARAALKAKDTKLTDKFLLTGLNQHPKSIPLHQLHARNSLAKKNPQAAKSSFKTLTLLYPNLLVKLKYEESLTWSEFNHPDSAKEALRAALQAFQKLPPRLQKNRDLQDLVAKIKTSLRS